MFLGTDSPIVDSWMDRLQVDPRTDRLIGGSADGSSTSGSADGSLGSGPKPTRDWALPWPIIDRTGGTIFCLVEFPKCSISIPLYTGGVLEKDPAPHLTARQEQAVQVLSSNKAPFRRYPECFLALVGLSPYYPFGENTYPAFEGPDRTDMGLLDYIRTADPRKGSFSGTLKRAVVGLVLVLRILFSSAEGNGLRLPATSTHVYRFHALRMPPCKLLADIVTSSRARPFLPTSCVGRSLSRDIRGRLTSCLMKIGRFLSSEDCQALSAPDGLSRLPVVRPGAMILPSPPERDGLASEEKMESQQEEQAQELYNRVAELEAHVMDVSGRLEGEFYPAYTTTRAWLGRRMVCRAVDYGMQEGLAAGYEHGIAGTPLSAVVAYNPETAKNNYLDAVRALEDVDFPLIRFV
ncbi:hypothetical protein Tco_1004595 [Tanacetum coccineum]|uniref:Uncharacterized protein n=1 Tax=Tanacetum coccineum TaxID=301880 RepID=A0ABQ5FE95_9ASTR